MITKNKLKQFFSKKRHLANMIVIIALLTIIGLNNYLPVGPGNYNQKQIAKITLNYEITPLRSNSSSINFEQSKTSL